MPGRIRSRSPCCILPSWMTCGSVRCDWGKRECQFCLSSYSRAAEEDDEIKDAKRETLRPITDYDASTYAIDELDCWMYFCLPSHLLVSRDVWRISINNWSLKFHSRSTDDGALHTKNACSSRKSSNGTDCDWVNLRFDLFRSLWGSTMWRCGYAQPYWSWQNANGRLPPCSTGSKSWRYVDETGPDLSRSHCILLLIIPRIDAIVLIVRSCWICRTTRAWGPSSLACHRPPPSPSWTSISPKTTSGRSRRY